jgi:hypothetical protein
MILWKIDINNEFQTRMISNTTINYNNIKSNTLTQNIGLKLSSLPNRNLTTIK